MTTTELLHWGRWATDPSATSEAEVRHLLDQFGDRVSITIVGADCVPSARAIARETTVEPTISSAAGRCGIAVVSATSSGQLMMALPQFVASAVVPIAIGIYDDQSLPNGLAFPTIESAATLIERLLIDPTHRDALLAEVRERCPPSPTITMQEAPIGPFNNHQIVSDFERAFMPSPVLTRAQTDKMISLTSLFDRYEMRRRIHDQPDDTTGMADAIGRFASRPMVSIIMPTFNTDPQFLVAAIESVLDQVYPHWQLCIADDGSSHPDTLATLASYEGHDNICVTRLAKNAGIVAASTAALATATGDFVTFVDHDDLLAIDALYWVVRLLNQQPHLDIVYTDEERIFPDGIHRLPFSKPDWSPNLLTSANYINHLCVYRHDLLRDVGGLRTGFDGAQDYDLLLRATERTSNIGHIARPLYAWRSVAGSTAEDPEAKPYAHDAGERALTEALARRGYDAAVSEGAQRTHYRARYPLTTAPLVSIIIPTRNRVDLLRSCVEAIAQYTEIDYELVIVDNQTDDPATLAYFDELVACDSINTKVVRYPHPFNYSAQMNLGARAASGDLLLLMNNDATVTADGWLTEMAEQAMRPEVGQVGVRLSYPDGQAQHEGVVIGIGYVASNIQYGDAGLYRDCVRDVAAVTAACALLRRSVFDEVGGFDEQLSVAYNDVDLSLRIGERGYQCVYLPSVEVFHPESASRGSLHPEANEALFSQRWGLPNELRDPFVNQSIERFNPLNFVI